ncbi:hypothetical protein AVEN_236988-1 [Araneus ventricosus]|uniref:Uncharacterized protein n=1 Tax=Araneus ventricosus TaxID=182803 RepID=A0A4Y2EJM0_ARAVE|nr:hypothetical protein AVEN_11971-1 [Araneus ventricosus]GBO42430.1 hypothetical protein AVEN_236988-1 [Araneus ventricosus]
MENEVLFSNIPENVKHWQQGNTALAQMNNNSRQQVTNNNSNSTNNSELAKRTSLQRDSSDSEDVQRRLSHLRSSGFLYLFRQDVTSHRII